MNTVINLKGNEELAIDLAIERNNTRELGSAYHYKEELIEKGVKELSEQNLRYNTKTGRIFTKKECIGYYSPGQELPKYNSLAEVIRWELIPMIMNAASMLSRGFKIS